MTKTSGGVDRGSGSKVKLSRFSVSATDELLMNYIMEKFQSFKIEHKVYIKNLTKTKPRLILVNASPSNSLSKLLKIGLNALEEENAPKHPKIELLEEFLNSGQLDIGVVAPYDLSFKQYLGEFANHPLAKVIAQGFYHSNVYMANNLLKNLNLEKVTSTYEIDFKSILKAFEVISKEESSAAIVVLYYQCCVKRQIDSIINDVQHTKSEYICEKCNPPKKYGFKENLIKHDNQMHQGVLSACTDCTKKFPNDFYLKQHRQHVHQKKEVALVCIECHCEKYTQKEMDRHMHSCHYEKKLHVCEACSYSFPRPGGLINHKKKPCLVWTL